MISFKCVSSLSALIMLLDVLFLIILYHLIFISSLTNLPLSVSRLSNLQALWISGNQSRPLTSLQKHYDVTNNKHVMTNDLFPQKPYEGVANTPGD